MPALEPTAETAHAHALALGELGLRVLPIKAGKQHPPMNSWQHAATNDPAKISNWYKGLYRDAGVGLAMGPQPNGDYLFAIDIDQHDPSKDGYENLADLEREHGALPDTWRSLTGGGGQHQIFKAPPGVEVRNQQNNGNRIAPGIDVRGDGGQIVVAPTVHPKSGREYAWEHGYAPWEIEVAEAPGWLVELVREPDAVSTPTAPQSSNVSAGGTVFDLQRDTWDWHTELANQGWTISHTTGNDTYWTRPGKNPRDGHSAVLHGHDVLVVFTTDIPPHWTQAATRTVDGSGWAFGPFGFYAATQHAGDRAAASRALHIKYGFDWPSEDLAGLIAPAAVPQLPDDYDSELLALLLDWHTFADTDHRAEEWLWEPAIPAKRSTAIFAPGGIGKSLIVLRMVLDIAARGTKVLYLDYEMTADDLDDRLTNMGVDPHTLAGTLHYALLPTIAAADTPEGGKAINRLAELVEAELVVIDTFARAVHGDENEADTVRQFYRQTGLHLKAAGRAFIRIDHAGKDITKGQRGTSAKNDDVDVVWQLRTTDTGYQLIAKKRRMGWVPETVNLTKHEDPYRLEIAGGITYPPGTAELAAILDGLDISAETAYQKVMVALREAGHPTRKQNLLAAQKYRRSRSQTVHFASDLVAPRGSQKTGNHAPNGSHGTTPGTNNGDIANTQLEDSGTATGTTGTNLASPTGTGSPPIGGTVPGPKPDELEPATQSLRFEDVL